MIDLKVTLEFTGRGVRTKFKKRRAGAAPSLKEQLFTPLDEMIALPMRELTTEMAFSMHARIFKGKNAKGGGFAPRGAFSDSQKRFWVAPSNQGGGRRPPHPRKEVVTNGKWKGWAIYPNYKAWLEAKGQASTPRNFVKSGQLRNSMAVVVDTPTSTRVVFTGSKVNVTWKSLRGSDGKLSEPQKFTSRIQRSQQAFLASHRDRYLMMSPSNAEIDQLLDSAALNMLQPFSDDLGVINEFFGARKGIQKSSRKAAKLGQRISRITSGR